MKKQLRTTDTVIAQLKADNQRLEAECTKQQRRIDKILNGHSNGQSIIEIRKEIEKSVIVKQLKNQVMILHSVYL